MKKKGLIISTVVMVVVLIASLTTATYAWFSSTATVSVEKFDMTTAAMEGLQIGVKETADGTVGTINNYVSDTISYASNKWTGSAGLSSKVALDDVPFIKNGIEHATTVYEADNFGDGKLYAADAAPEGVQANDFITAKTYSTDDPENPIPTEFRASTVNTDYLDVQFGVRATVENVKQVYYTITVDFTEISDNGLIDALKPGMAAALMLEITTSEGTVTVNAFDGWTLGTSFTGTDDKGATTKEGDALTKWTYSGWIYNNSETAIDDSIQIFRVRAWIEGSDDACRTRTAGTGAEIGIEFGYVAEGSTKTITNGVMAAA